MGYSEIIKGFIALLFLSSSWSYLGRQTIGILSTILILAKKDTKNDVKVDKNLIKERFWQKNAFNTNPYCTGVMVGIVLNKQNEIFNESFFALQHIFGAIGDDFFWRALRPTLLSLAVLILLIGYLVSPNFHLLNIFTLAPLLFLIPYNIIAQGIRVRGLYEGRKHGRSAAVRLIQDLRKPITKLYNILAFIMGMLIVLLPLIVIHHTSGHSENLWKSIIFLLLIILLVVLSYLAMRTERANSYLLISGLLIFLIIKVL